MVKKTAARRQKHVAWCPYCEAGFTYSAVKSLWGQVNRRHQLVKEGKPVIVHCPACEHKLTEDQVKSMWGRATASQRSTFGAGPGRPRVAERCPCGAMTLARAIARGHRCQKE